MPPSRQTIAAVSTCDVSLAHNEIPARKSSHVITDSINDAGKLMTNGHRHWNCFLRPVIPIVDVHVSAADRRLQHSDQHVVTASFWNRNILKPEARLGFRLHNCLHRRLHDSKLGETGKRGKIFASANGQS
jgi:hypothetical protein